MRHLCGAIRKLAAHTPVDKSMMLYRGVRGQLDPAFWRSADAAGLICAVDMAFLSTSKQQATPFAYMAPGKNVLWRLHTSEDDDSGLHLGADISMFSQFAEEEEVLFPPMTMLQAVRDQRGLRLSSSGSKVLTTNMASGFEGIERVVDDGNGNWETSYMCVDVMPCFL